MYRMGLKIQALEAKNDDLQEIEKYIYRYYLIGLIKLGWYQ